MKTARRRVLSYLVAVAAVGLALAADFAVHPLVGDRQLFAFFYLAVLVSAWWGVGPGLLALGLGYLVGHHFFVTPRAGLIPIESGDVVAAVAYLVVGSAIVALTGLVRVAERRAEGRERSLRVQDAEREAVMMNMGEGLYTVDTEGRVTFINSAAQRLFGWESGELLGRRMHDATHHRHPDGTPFPASDCAGLGVLREGVTLIDHEDVFIRRDGTFFPVVYSSSRVVVDGTVTGLVVVFRDVTRHRQAEQEREELLELAERARAASEAAARSLEASSRAKDEFLAMLAHELRNPLAAVRNAVATASLDESRRERALEIAGRQAGQLGRMVDDLLDVARITSGRIALRKGRVRLADVVEQAVESIRPFVEMRGLSLIVTLPSQPVQVEADAARLEQVFVNLLSNAAKYTDAGGRIDVVAACIGDGQVAVGIRDTGMGIAPEMLPRMWDLFAQSDRGIDRKQGGLGIGLTVARRLVELHGARIEARSDGVGKGAEFVVTLAASPAAEGDADATAVARAEPTRRASARVLLVEDNRDTAESLTMLLHLHGHRVRTVYDGSSALDAVRAEAPDVMLVDIGLPGMDGYEVARRIRGDARLRDVLLIAVTGYGRDDDRHRALAAGFDHHLVKPVNPGTLDALLASLRRPEASGPGILEL